ncbi:TlpA family protein disulfide reductase [Amnibacterium setariae]|uniref:Thioredoxin n=1 Tax=Amnibacterium setariae TaxID=2306585 RepID=A0A3A1UB82_9MICO|nr:thioredoxin family protein [Amnibacterium setariae]RIX30576.1 thioredoxin [Amnibacterium setariae]
MSPWAAGAVLLAVVLLATGLGLLSRARAGRASTGSGRVLAPEDVGAAAAFGARATLVQLSTPTCAQCPGTARLLRDVAAQHPGVVHLEVDLARHPEVADRFGVLQTPTTLLVDGDRRLRARIGGAPRPDHLDRELETLLRRTP